MFLLSLIHFIWQLRSQSAEKEIRIRNAWQELAHGIAAKFSKRGDGMSPRVTIALVLGIVLLILGFPSSLYARRSFNRTLRTAKLSYWPFPYQSTSARAIVSTTSILLTNADV